MKETYLRTELLLTEFHEDDVISTSGPFRTTPEEYETRMLRPKHIDER